MLLSRNYLFASRLWEHYSSECCLSLQPLQHSFT